MSRCVFCALAGLALVSMIAGPAAADDWEITPESAAALQRGLGWLARTQGDEGNWQSNDLGLVSMGALAFLAAGHTPGIGPYGKCAERALDYVLRHAQPSGLLNIADQQRDMYNHGLATFVLGQAYGMSNDPRIGPALDRALKLISATQCQDGGWDYVARRQAQGHDLSLAVMQAKALRSAVDSGLEVPDEVVQLAVLGVRAYYSPRGVPPQASEERQRAAPGQFTYGKGGDGGTVAMAAAGVVCLQEFGRYDDWRIPKNIAVLQSAIKRLRPPARRIGQVPFDAYTLYYVGQALYQVGGTAWEQGYPVLRDYLVAVQVHDQADPARDGLWQSGAHVSGRAGELYGTSVGCFILAIPNRYLPILQEGRIDSLNRPAGER